MRSRALVVGLVLIGLVGPTGIGVVVMKYHRAASSGTTQAAHGSDSGTGDFCKQWRVLKLQGEQLDDEEYVRQLMAARSNEDQ